MQPHEIDLRAIVELFWRQLHVMALAVAVVMGTAVGALTLLPPVYTAVALVLVAPAPQQLVEDDEETDPPGSENRRLSSEVELIQAETTLLHAIRHGNFAGQREFAWSDGWSDLLRRIVPGLPPSNVSADEVRRATLETLRRSLRVTRRNDSFVIAVEATASAPDLAAEIANAVASASIHKQIEAKVGAILSDRATINSRVSQAATEMALAQTELASFMAAQAQSPPESGVADAGTRLFELQRRLDLSRSHYDRLLARSGELEQQAYLQVADSRIAAEATPPARPSFPQPIVVLTLGAILSVAAAAGLAYLNDRFVSGFASLEQVQSVLRIHAVASVLRQKKRACADGGEPATLGDAPLTEFAESIRKLRLGLDQVLEHRPGPAGQARGSVIMVTSAVPEEGKTTLALALARIYAKAARSTVLVDCDLRRPSLYGKLGTQPSLALLDYLEGVPLAPSLEDLLITDPVGQVRVILGGHSSIVATDRIVCAKAFANLIQELAARFDIVILDAPPIDPVVDAQYLATFADIVAYVVRWQSTSQKIARRALSVLQRATRPGTQIVGILNQEAGAQSTRSRKYAGYYVEA